MFILNFITPPPPTKKIKAKQKREKEKQKVSVGLLFAKWQINAYILLIVFCSPTQFGPLKLCWIKVWFDFGCLYAFMALVICIMMKWKQLWSTIFVFLLSWNNFQAGTTQKVVPSNFFFFSLIPIDRLGLTMQFSISDHEVIITYTHTHQKKKREKSKKNEEAFSWGSTMCPSKLGFGIYYTLDENG